MKSNPLTGNKVVRIDRCTALRCVTMPRSLAWLLVSCLGVLCASGALIWPTSATAGVIIDFNSLLPEPGDGTVIRGNIYEEDGFRLTNLSYPTGPGGAFKSIHSGNFRYSDSVSFFNNVQNGVTQLTEIGGGTFDLLSIDLDSLNWAVSTHATFIGYRADNTTVSETFYTDAVFPSRQTFYFPDSFEELTRVTWMNEAGNTGPFLPFHQFDNIVVAPHAQAVPEPSSFVLMSLGALSLAVCAWRRRRGPVAGAREMPVVS